MHARFLPCLFLALLACRDAGQNAFRTSAPPTEFILAAGDSAYWVKSDSAGIHVRGAPIELARVDDHFYEVYVVDDDHSFESADLIGQGVYRRDLRTGDSVRVFTDSLVPAIAREYARDHPDERRLLPDEEGDTDPAIRATATLEFAGTHGPFVSYTLHTDVESRGKPLWHTSRNGVLDLRTGRRSTLADVAGAEAGKLAREHDKLATMVLDSVRVRAPELLRRYQPDPTSFTLTTSHGVPAIAFAIPTQGAEEVDRAVELPPIPFAVPAWWSVVAESVPSTSGDGSLDSWQRPGYAVIARYDSTSEGRVVLRDSSAHEWPIGAISEPASRIYWLDRPTFDSVTRHALVRAFEEAASYGNETHIASRQQRSLFQLTTLRK
jgi:hypothetical protein